jgi:hypothetical protein
MKCNFAVKSLAALLSAVALVASVVSPTLALATPSSATVESAGNAVAQSSSFYIGQSYGGGIIFWIDGTGQHGLIAAASDQGYIWWGDRYYLPIGTTGTAVGTGAANTRKIIAVQGTAYNYAALACAKYRGGGYADWFLPSKDELYQLYLRKNVVGGFIRGGYWSSSEHFTQFDHYNAWQKYFYNDLANFPSKDRVDGVRAVREF